MEKTLSGKETLQDIIGLVDLAKVKLPSYTISARKFDAIGDAYTKITYMLCMLNVASSTDEDVKNTAFRFIKKINQNPEYYSYSYMNSVEKEFVEEATIKFFGNSNGNQQIEHLKRTYRTKGLKDVLAFLLENLQTYAKELPEEVLYKALCTSYVNDSICQMQNIHEEIAVSSDKDVEQTVEEDVCETPKKKTFWQKLFGR